MDLRTEQGQNLLGLFESHRSGFSELGRLSKMEFLSSFVAETQQTVVDAVQRMIEDRGIKAQILEEAQSHAQIIANHLRDPESPEPARFEPVPIGEVSERIQYQLVLEYLESIGLKFAPTVMRYESQHPNVFSDRANLAAQLGLRSYDRTPLLLQMIEETRKARAGA
jgi:hypothetical protein